MAISHEAAEAAHIWHERIGRFLTGLDWRLSIGASYPGLKVKDGKQMQSMRRLGSGMSGIMIDANDAVLADDIDLTRVPLLDQQACTFKYAEAKAKTFSLTKSQINWALDTRRVFPLFLLRPEKKGAMPCLRLSHTPDQIVVCRPSGSFEFSQVKVRTARDAIVKLGLERKWATAAHLRQTISTGEHLSRGENYQNKLLADHAKFLELLPLSFWLPQPGTGDYLALNEALLDRKEIEFDRIPFAREVFVNAQSRKQND